MNDDKLGAIYRPPRERYRSTGSKVVAVEGMGGGEMQPFISSFADPCARGVAAAFALGVAQREARGWRLGAKALPEAA